MAVHGAVSESNSSSVSASPRAVLRNRNFRLLWLGEAISILGDQFHLIALPWLVLQLTNDALATGTVLATAGIPRALFMLVGGAFTDRFSPRTIMLLSNLIRFVLVALLAVLTFTGAIQVWMLYIFALCFGLADAFFFPAQSSMVPQLLEPQQLAIGNTIVQGTAQLAVFLGPVLAGGLIASFAAGSDSGVPDTRGIGLAFAFDSLTFLASAFTLTLMRLTQKRKNSDSPAASSGILDSIREGLAFVWNDAKLRVFFLLVAAINVLVVGPIMVGIPVLANQRLPEGSLAYGAIMSAFGAGALIGMVLAGALPKPPVERRGLVLLVILSTLGFGLALLGLISVTWMAVVVMFLLAIANGYVNIIFITWLQVRTPPDMIGRVMSLLMFASIGLLPVSTALAGAIANISVTGLMVGAGLLMAAVSLGATLNSQVRSLEDAAPA